MFEFKDNPKFKEVYYSEVHDKRFYMPANLSEYHISRQMAANAQNIYANSGITKETLVYILNQMLDIVNEEKADKRLKSNLSVLINNLLYRTAYPVDMECGLRLGAIYIFIEGENPDLYSLSYTMQKEKLAKGDIKEKIEPDPALYDFFLQVGLGSMEAYQGLSEDLKSMEYLMKREKTLKTLMPTNIPSPK